MNNSKFRSLELFIPLSNPTENHTHFCLTKRYATRGGVNQYEILINPVKVVVEGRFRSVKFRTSDPVMVVLPENPVASKRFSQKALLNTYFNPVEIIKGMQACCRNLAMDFTDADLETASDSLSDTVEWSKRTV